MPTNNFHVSYPDVNRYWSPLCEPYAGGDALLTAMSTGWKVIGAAQEEEFWLGGLRLVVVLHFTLSKAGQTMKMRVLSNPFVRRLVFFEKIGVEPISAQALQQRRARDVDTVGEREA
ncbi:MAG: hypothetical protein KJ065_22845 [Anaerolineae bacterium]|nr:hypothetical protein [Anaerolineae bacterium]